ncbi:unnamed protein product, partial [Didymodactylos carnosus]
HCVEHNDHAILLVHQKTKDTNTLSKLTSTSNGKINTMVNVLLAIISKNPTTDMIEKMINYIELASTDYHGIPMIVLLNGFLKLVKYESVRKFIANARDKLELFIQIAKNYGELDEDNALYRETAIVAYNIIWLLSTHDQIRKQLNENEEFMLTIQQLNETTYNDEHLKDIITGLLESLDGIISVNDKQNKIILDNVEINSRNDMWNSDDEDNVEIHNTTHSSKVEHETRTFQHSTAFYRNTIDDDSMSNVSGYNTYQNIRPKSRLERDQDENKMINELHRNSIIKPENQLERDQVEEKTIDELHRNSIIKPKNRLERDQDEDKMINELHRNSIIKPENRLERDQVEEKTIDELHRNALIKPKNRFERDQSEEKTIDELHRNALIKPKNRLERDQDEDKIHELDRNPIIKPKILIHTDDEISESNINAEISESINYEDQTYQTIPIILWTNKHVLEWCRNNDLTIFEKLLADYDGKSVMKLYDFS